jgi:hypothetical protein
LLTVMTAVAAVLISTASLGTAQGKSAAGQYAPTAALASSILDSNLLAKAPVDECFPADGTVGVRPITYPDASGNCPSGFVPKRNEAYVWGLTKTGDNLWFGTASNVVCGVYSGYLEQTDPTYVEGDYVCETGAKDSEGKPIPGVSDSRTPSTYHYDLAAKKLEHVAGPDPTDNGAAKFYYDGWTTNALTLLKVTGGFRSAGSLGNTAILAGPGRYMDETGTVQAKAALNFFAFDATTNELLGYKSMAGYTNIRKWLTYDPTPGDEDPGQLYAGVGVSGGTGGILRWTPTEANPLNFDVVGTTGSEIAELVVHQGRIFGASWPSHPATPDLTKEVYAGLYMSPEIPAGGFTAANSSAWEKVWAATDYEPDAVTATTYGTGALASFDGYLYWGTMQVPGRGALVHDDYYPPDPAAPADTSTFMNTYRAITIFRGRDFGTADEQKQVVYGQRRLNTWVPDGLGSGAWVNQLTKMGTPLWGSAGFGNMLNNYTWTMDVYGGSLYVGTMDFGYLGRQGFGDLQDLLDAIGYSFGADLFRIDSSSSPGVFESKDGVGNITNYGIRTMVADDALYLGTANPMNLNPQGGWELLRLRPRYALDLSTTGATTTTGTARDVTAQLDPAKKGVTVHFGVTGANTASGDVVTDADGVAAWSYTGASPGTDTVTATADSMGYGFPVDQLEVTAKATWAAPQQEQPLASSAQPDGWIRAPRSAFIGDNVYNTTADQQTVRRGAHRTDVRKFRVRVYNDGSDTAVFTLKGIDSTRKANVRYLFDGANVTAAMKSVAGLPVTVPAGGHQVVVVKVKIGRHAAIGAHKSAQVTMTWTGDGLTRADAVKGVVTVK